MSIEPFAIADAWSLLSPEEAPRIDAPRWANQARVFFDGASLIAPERALDPIDAFEISLDGARVFVVTMPAKQAPKVIEAAVEGVLAIGGAGFDALVAKGKRVWQVKETRGREANVVAAVMASVLLAPIVPPGGGTIFGVKGARERLERHSSGGM